MDEGTSEEFEKVVKWVLECQLPEVLSRWVPSTRESKTRPSLGTGSKLHNSHTISPFGDNEWQQWHSKSLGCASGELASW